MSERLVVIRIDGRLRVRREAADFPHVPGATLTRRRGVSGDVAEYTGHYFKATITRGHGGVIGDTPVWEVTGSISAVPGDHDPVMLDSDRYAIRALFEGFPVFITTKAR